MRTRALLIALFPLTFASSCQKEAAAPPAQESADVVSPVAESKSAERAQSAADGLAAVAQTQEDPAKRAAEARLDPARGTASAKLDRQTPIAGDAPVNKVPVATASALIRALGSHASIEGKLHFAALPDGAGVQVTGSIRGLSPGEHGIHVHEHGDCSDQDGLRAGGHFNPTRAAHGGLGASQSHVGDMGNLRADPNGNAQVSLVLPAARLGSHAASLLGRAIIVHERKDDLKSQPSGDAGGRVACGVIVAP